MAAVSVRPAEEHEREWLRETLAGRVRARPPLLRLREEDAPHLTLNALVPGRGARRR